MTRRHLFTCLGAFSLCGCSPTITYIRERLSLTISSPGVFASGSGVVEFSGYATNRFLGASGMAYQAVKGEAIVVDLGARGLLCWLMRKDPDRNDSGDAYDYLRDAFPDFAAQASAKVKAEYEASHKQDDNSFIRNFGRLLNQSRPSGELSPQSLGLLVLQRDPSDRRTLERVDPLNLAATFGSGVSIMTASIAITDEPVTRETEKKLPWLLDEPETALIFPESNGRLLTQLSTVQTLTFGDFRSHMNE